MTSDNTELLTPAQVAAKFRVDPKTVTRWARRGWLRSIRLPSGQRRYLAGDVERLLQFPPENGE
jgi:predicted site-specific integrase-resolvase